MGDLVHIRLEPELRDAMRVAMKDERFSSETEYIRDAIRRRLALTDGLRALRALQGSGKLPVERPVERPGGKAASAVSADELFRQYGLR